MNNKVSIITPVFNAEKYLSICIDSVIAQSYQDWELILCDDCSSDGSVGLIEAYAFKEERITLIKSPINQGAGVARNKALELAGGRFIAFLDCDDFWHPEKLEKQLNFLNQGGFALVFCQYFVVIGNSKEPKYIIRSPKKVSYRRMLCNDYIGFLTVLYDTVHIKKQFMPEIRRRQDWAYKLKLLEKVDFAYGIQEPLAFYRVGNSSLSSNKLKLLKYNFSVYNNELGYSKLASFALMIIFLFHYFQYKFTSKKIVNINSRYI